MSLPTETIPSRPTVVRDDIAYVLPMMTFLVLTSVGGKWPVLYPISYVAKTVVVALMLWLFRGAYTRINWKFAWLGLLVGVIGIVQWVGMQLFLQNHFELFKPPSDAFNPTQAFENSTVMYGFVAFRWLLGATLLVPVMEELFWRDFVWRTIAAPNDFKLASVGELDWKAFVIVPAVFALVHGNWWLTAIVWAFMLSGLLVYTKSIGACIVAHATTNFLLGVYVLWTKDWAFW